MENVQTRRAIGGKRYERMIERGHFVDWTDSKNGVDRSVPTNVGRFRFDLRGTWLGDGQRVSPLPTRYWNALAVTGVPQRAGNRSHPLTACRVPATLRTSLGRKSRRSGRSRPGMFDSCHCTDKSVERNPQHARLSVYDSSQRPCRSRHPQPTPWHGCAARCGRKQIVIPAEPGGQPAHPRPGTRASPTSLPRGVGSSSAR